MRGGRDSLCARLKKKLEFYAGEAGAFREAYNDAVSELAVLCANKPSGPAFLRDLLGSMTNVHIISLIKGCGAEIAPQLADLNQATQPSSDYSDDTASSRFHSGFEASKLDILTYDRDDGKDGVVLKLTDEATRVLEKLRPEDEGELEDGALAEVMQRVDSLLQRADSMSAFFDKSTMSVLHCLIHLIRAIIRTTKYANAFKTLPDRAKKFSTTMALKLIVTPFGRAWGAREMLFFGPKDALRGVAYHEAVLQLLTSEFIPTDTSLWPTAWTKDGVIQLRSSVDGDTPLVGRRVGQKPVHVLEIWAGCTLVISVRIYGDRLKVAGGDGIAASDITACSAEVDVYDEDDGDHSDNELNQLIAEAEKEMEDAANAGCDDDPLSTGGSSGDESDSIVMHSDQQTFETDAAVTTTLICHSDNIQLAPGTGYFSNPFYIRSTRGGSGSGKADVVYPIASLFKYHASLWPYTSAAVRGLLPNMVWHTSHVEESFKGRVYHTCSHMLFYKPKTPYSICVARSRLSHRPLFRLKHNDDSTANSFLGNDPARGPSGANREEKYARRRLRFHSRRPAAI